jgi:hypothetical protein
MIGSRAMIRRGPENPSEQMLLPGLRHLSEMTGYMLIYGNISKIHLSYGSP